MILTTGWTPIDPLLSLVTAVLILRSTWRLLARTIGVLMEGVPSHLDYEAIGSAPSQVPGVAGVHAAAIVAAGAPVRRPQGDPDCAGRRAVRLRSISRV